MNAADVKKPLAADLRYYLPRWLVFGVVAGLLGAALTRTIQGERDIRADSARPETISYMQRNGFPRCEGVVKWKGSVEDGMAHVRQYERVVIHPRCTHTAEEFRLFSYKMDKLSGDVLTDNLDRHNHCIDALRYAVTPNCRRCQRAKALGEENPRSVEISASDCERSLTWRSSNSRRMSSMS